jgi:NAD(P)H dehydrogenase (quinone)
MKVLVVYTHPNPKSFNQAILEQFTKGLNDGGHTFEILDLYKINFNPVIQLEDYAQFMGGEMPPDVLEQQKKIIEANALAFIYPIISWSFPALLKGWLDRVFSFGFAYRMDETGWHSLLKHQKALLICTTGVPEAMYKSMGIEEVITKYNEIEFGGAGISKTEHFFFYTPQINAEDRNKYLELAYSLGKEF